MKACTIICCADHGVSEEKVSAFSSKVTVQMMKNYVDSKGAAANAYSKYIKSDLIVVDMGVKSEEKIEGVLNRKIGSGTKNITKGAAMTTEQAQKSIETGIEIVKTLSADGYNYYLPGEMGISNTTSSAAIVSMLLNIEPEKVTGRGTNISDERFKHKIETVKKAIEVNGRSKSAVEVLAKVGGFELGAIAGIIIGAQQNNATVMLDGFNCSAAALIACSINPECKKNLIATHLSREPGQKIILESLGLRPLLNLNLALGEAIGSSIAYKIIENEEYEDEEYVEEEEIEEEYEDEDDEEKFEIEISVYTNGADDLRYSEIVEEEDEEIEMEIKKMDETNIAVTDRTFNFYMNTMPRLDRSAMERCRKHLNELTKPENSLGILEEIAEQIAGISGESEIIGKLKTHLICLTDKEDEAEEMMEDYQNDEINVENKFAGIYEMAESYGIDLTLAIAEETKEYSKAFDFGRMTAEDISFKVPIIGITTMSNGFNEELKKILLNEDDSLKYEAEEFLKYVPKRLKNLVSAIMGAIIAATHNSSLVIADTGGTDITARYLEKLIPSVSPYILHAKKIIMNEEELTEGKANCIGIEVVRAALYGVSEMKTFREVGVDGAENE